MEKRPGIPEDFQQENLQPKSKEKKKLYIIDTGNSVEEKARDVAESRLTASQAELKGVGGFVKKIWKYNWGREIIRQNEIAKVRAQIKGSENLYAGDKDTTGHEASMGAVVQRFSNEYDQTLHDQSKDPETKEVLNNSQIQGEVKALILDYANGKLDDQTFNEEKVRLFSSVKEKSRGVIEKGDLYASNIFEIAKECKSAVEHGEGLNRLDLDFEIIVGRTRLGARTEANFNTVDKITEKIKNTRIGSLLNETTVSLGVAAAYSLSTGLARKVTSSKLAAVGSFGATALLGAGVAGLRESARLEEERRQHGREMAVGGKYKKDKSPRREELEKFRIETKDANALADELEGLLYDTKLDKEGNVVSRELKELNKEQFDAAMIKLGEIRGRTRYSDQHNVDLISYSSDKTVEQERTRLQLVAGQAGADLKNASLSNPEASKFISEKVNFSQALENSTELFIATETLLKGDASIEKKNEMFKKMKHAKVARAGVKGLLTGIAVGATAQEVVSLFKDNQIGLGETVSDWIHRGNNRAQNGDHYTALAALAHWVKGDIDPASSRMHETVLGGHHFKMPEGMELKPNSDHTWNLVDQDGKVVGDHIIGKADKISPYASHILGKQGITVTNFSHHAITEHHQTLTGDSGSDVLPKDYIEGKNFEGTTRISRDMWYENDTPKVFDKNELKLWWGGHNGTGLDEHGNYVYNIKHMSQDGSYEGKFSANAQELMKEGKVKMMISLSRDTQLHAFEIPIDANGNAIIDPNSEVGRLAFATVNGHAKFIGKFAEVSQMMGADKRGIEHIRLLATDIGHGLDKIPAGVDHITHKMKNTPFTIFDKPSDYRVDAPPFIPVFGRTPLEPLKRKKAEAESGDVSITKKNKPEVIFGAHDYYYYGSGNSENQQNITNKVGFAETIRKNPEAKLDAYDEAQKYLNKQDADYLKKVGDFASEMGEMNPDCRLSICIPVAGHEEADNIYETLKNYTYQQKDGKPLDPKLFEIALNINHPENDKEGNLLNADSVISEVRRFQTDYPAMNVRIIYERVPNDQATIGRARKILSDTVLKRSVARGKGKTDLIMVSNDADNKGLATEYIANFIEKFDQESDVDAMVGQLDWDVEAYVRKPLIHVGTRLMQYLIAQYRSKGSPPNSSGANFAYRSSIYAAVDGYVSGTRSGEDTDLGRKITVARTDASHKGIVYAGLSKSRVFTSARRSERVLKFGLPPSKQWTEESGNEGFQTLDGTVRGTKWENENEVIDFNNPDEVKKFITNVEDIINKTLGDNVYSRESHRALNWLGVKFRVENRAIVITDATKLLKGLKEYQEEGSKILEIKKKGIQEKTIPEKSKSNDAQQPKAEEAISDFEDSSAQENPSLNQTKPEEVKDTLENYEIVTAAPVEAKRELDFTKSLAELKSAKGFDDFLRKSGKITWSETAKELTTTSKKQEFVRFIQDLANQLMAKDQRNVALFERWALTKGIGYVQQNGLIEINGLSLSRLGKDIKPRWAKPVKSTLAPNKVETKRSTQEVKEEFANYFDEEFVVTLQEWDKEETPSLAKFIKGLMADLPAEFAKKDYKSKIFQKEFMQALQDGVNFAISNNFKGKLSANFGRLVLKALTEEGFDVSPGDSSGNSKEIRINGMSNFLKRIETPQSAAVTKRPTIAKSQARSV
jgi:hypothetical protein